MGGTVEVTAITGELDARALLRAELSPATVRAVALRADELRFLDPPAAVGVAEAALDAQARLPRRLRRPRLIALTWSVFGSACRATARFDEAEVALLQAAEALPATDARNRVEILERLAYLRAAQRRKKEACELIAVVVAFWRPRGGVALGRRLSAASAILVQLEEYAGTAADAAEALSLLPLNGDRFHLSALVNLALARLELCSTNADLEAAAGLVTEARRHIEPGTFPELKLFWLRGRALRRFGRFDEAVSALEEARVGIDQRADGFDRALLLVDLAETYIQAGDHQSAGRLALSSFSVLHALRNEPDAYKALHLLHQAASDLSLDRAAVRSVRAALLAARR